MEIKTSEPLLQNPHKIIKKITHFWDTTSASWLQIWGTHIHHGYYDRLQSLTFPQAQEELLKKLSAELSFHPHDKILDIGCGLGGSSIYLAKTYQANVTGVSLSATQINLALKLAKTNKIKNVNFLLDDAHILKNFNNNYFDIVWSLESCEQFYNKKLFLQQAYRVLRPGGQLMLATWCTGEEKYTDQYAKKYKTLCQTYDLPYMPTIAWYKKTLQEENFYVKQALDWSSYVAKSWEVGLSLANTYSFLKLIKMSGWRGFQAIKRAKLMLEAYQQKIMKYGVFIANKS